MQIRHIPHQFDDSIHGDDDGNQLLKRALQKQAFAYFLREWATFTQSVRPDETSDLCVLKQKKSPDWSVFVGAGGYLYLYLRLYKFFSTLDAGLLECLQATARESLPDEKVLQLFDAQHYLQLANVCFVNVEQLCNQSKDTTITFYLSQAAIWLMGCHICYHNKDPVRFDLYLAKMLKYFDLVMSALKHVQYELLYGLPGYIYVLLHFQRDFCRHDVPPEYQKDLRAHIFKLCYSLVEQGFRNFNESDTLQSYLLNANKQYPPNFRLVYTFYKQEYVGAAHGLLGVVQVLLLAIKQKNLDIDEHFTRVVKWSLKLSLDNLSKLQFPSGNFPVTFDDLENDYLQQFCHGAPGAIAPLMLAYDIYNNDKYPPIAVKACDSIWKYGLLKKGSGICHGISGNAYAFLTMYRYTMDLRHYMRAFKFITFKDHPEIVETIKQFDFAQRMLKGATDNPFSLMNGLAGDLVSQLDFIAEGGNGLPGYELS